MSQQPGEPEAPVRELLQLRLIAALGTTNDDDSILLTPLWYLYEDGRLYLPTGSRSRKARNIRARPDVTVLIDQRNGAQHRWASATGSADLIDGPESAAINARVRARYLSAAGEAVYGKLIAEYDDVTVVVTPRRWRHWAPALADIASRHGLSEADTVDWFLPSD
jgi:PPOX class probable F420-dependent enzyme